MWSDRHDELNRRTRKKYRAETNQTSHHQNQFKEKYKYIKFVLWTMKM
jgi:hypothetical protein